MGKPKKRTSSRRRDARRSHLGLELARKVNASSPVKVFTTRRQNPKKVVESKAPKAAIKPAKVTKTPQAA